MIDQCRLCLTLFNQDYVSEIAGSIAVVEKNPGGAGTAIFNTDKPCVIVKSHNSPPLLWALAQRKCADGAFLLFEKGEAHLHIVELKSKIKIGTWSHILAQFEGMFLTSLAVARLLQVCELARVTCYVAGTEDCMTNALQSASPILVKTPVGKHKTFGGHESWEKEIIDLPFSVKAPLVKGWKNAAGVVDFGSV